MRAALSGALFVGLALSVPALANDDVIKNTSDPNNWASQSGNYALDRYSKLDQINTGNVGQLKVAWTFSTGVLRGHEGSPLVIGNTIFVHTPFPNTVYALDLDKDNEIIWKYEPKQDPSVIPIMCCDTVNRGVAYAEGKVLLYQADTTLVALDAKTGKELWKVVNGDVKRRETGTNAPIVIKDKIIEKYDPAVNWSSGVDLDPKSARYGRPTVVAKYSTFQNGQDVNTTGVVPAALGTKDQQPAAYSPLTGLFYVPTNHVAMDYEPFKVSYTAGQPYVGATLSMYPPKGDTNLGNFIAWDAGKGKIVWSIPETFSVWSGALATAGGVVFYGTLEGYLKAVDQKDGKELFRFKTPSGIIGNVFTYGHKGKQFVGVYSGIGGWAGIGLAAGLTNPTDGLGAVGGYAALSKYTALGGSLTVFSLP